MLKDVFTVEVILTQNRFAKFDPPMLIHREELDRYPSNDEIESLIAKHVGDQARVNKTFKLL